MKHIIFILFLFIGIASNAQTNPSGFPTQFSSGWFRHGWHQSDSGEIIAPRIPNFTPRFPGTTILYQNAGVDTTLHFWTGGRWIKILTSGVDTTSLSNRINLKLNISDTSLMLAQYLRKIDTTNKWVQNVYARNDSLFKFKNGTETFVHTFPTIGTGTVTSVALSMPSAFTVTGSPITTSGTFSVSGAGTTLQYIRGNGTLGTFDTAAIPNFYLKVRGLLSATSPLQYNNTTGVFSILDATTVSKGVASFNASNFSVSSGAVSLADLVTAGSCINCQLSINSKGQIQSYADGNELAIYNAPGAGDTLVIGNGDTVKRLNVGYGLNSITTATNITHEVDTTEIATQYDLTQLVQANNGLSKSGDTVQFGQTISAVGNPAALNSNREIPLNGFNTVFTGTGNIGIGTNAPGTSKLNVVASGTNRAITASTGTGIGIFGSSSGNAIVGQSSGAGIGIQGSTSTGIGVEGSGGIGGIGGRFYTTAQGGVSDDIALQLEKLPTGTGSANGIGFTIMFKNPFIGDFVANESGKMKNYFTNATSGSQSSAFEFHLVNNAVSARKMLISPNGQLTLDGYPALTPQTDFVNILPIGYNITSGLIQPMANWTSFASGLNLYNADSTLSTNRTVTQSGRYLRFQDGIDYTQFLGALQTIQPDSTSNLQHVRQILPMYAGTPAQGMLTWYEHMNGTAQSPDRPNLVYMRGFNLGPGGGAAVMGLPAIGESWEAHYKPSPGDPAWLQEYHKFYIQPNGTQRRLESWTVQINTNNWNVYYTTPGWSLRDTFAVDYLSASTASASDRTTLLEIKAGNEATKAQLIANGAADMLTLKSNTVGQFQFDDFTEIDFGNSNLYNVTDNVWGIQQISQGFNIVRGTNPYGIYFRNGLAGAIDTYITTDNATGEFRHYAGSGGYHQTFYTNGVERMTLKDQPDLITLTGNNAARSSIYKRNTNSAGNTSLILDNDRTPFTCFSYLLTGASADAGGNNLGVARADRTMLLHVGASGQGMAVGTVNNTTLVFGTNDTEAARFNTSQELQIGSTTDQGAFTLQNTGGLYQSGAVTINLGSDATGDIFYRNSGGAFTRLGIGSSGQVVTVSGGLPSYQTPTTTLVGTNTNDNAVAGNLGEEINSTVSTYTNYTTTATYQNITSITLTAGDWDLSAFFTYSSNAATITAASNAIFVISTTTASAAGATEGKNIAYLPQAALLGTSLFSDAISPYRVSISSTTTYYLNTQATFTLGNPQYVGGLRARRVR